MATSIQTFGKRVEIFNDFDLLALIALTNEIGDRAGERFDSLRPLFAVWKQNCIGYGPGTIDLELESISTNELAKSNLGELLTSVLEKLGEFGDTIPSAFLKIWCQAPGVKFKNFPTTNVRSTIRRIRGEEKGVRNQIAYLVPDTFSPVAAANSSHRSKAVTSRGAAIEPTFQY
jgi:hypothetical protein